MTRFALLCLAMLGSGVASAEVDAPRPVPIQGNPVLISHGSPPLFKSAAADTFCLYGGPGVLEGKFQDASGLVPDRQGWISRDRTQLEPMWHPSTFNAATLNANGLGNHAMWAGQDATQQPSWIQAPGYGNNWDARLEWRSGPLTDPQLAQDVELEFVFHHETEPTYDYFRVEAQIAGAWMPLLVLDGDDRDLSGQFVAPGRRYPDDFPVPAIHYAGGDYSGPGSDEIVLRLRVTSDGAWSDEDGLWDSDGAAQVDDITVRYLDGASPVSTFDDFEGPGPFRWIPTQAPYAGDFAQVFARAIDLDPCVENVTPLWGFMDDGSGPFNPGYSGTGTGGTLSPTWSYGIPGGWVVNYNGGVSGNEVSLENEIVSPSIAWDLPGAADDGAEVVGGVLRFDVWNHGPLTHGIYWSWWVRSSVDAGGTWSQWRSRNFIYFASATRWENRNQELTNYLEPDRTHLQVSFRVHDLAATFAFPGNDATPGPWFDNVAVDKFRVFGPSISAVRTRLFQDTFPNSGNLDLNNKADLSCRLDMAADISTGSQIVPGDSVVVSAVATIPGSSVARVEMNWILDVNPIFAGVRTQPPGTTVIPGASANGWDQWTGSVIGQPTASAGQWFFDLPDGPPNLNAPWQAADAAMFYPGDRLRYHFECEDDVGRISTLPANLDGFSGGVGWNREFVVRALPDIDSQGVRADLLYVSAAGPGAHEDLMLDNLERLLRGEPFGKDVPASSFDIYSVKGGSSRVSNGVGSARHHGPSLAQLIPYRCVFYDSGGLIYGFPSNGTDVYPNDKSDDLGLLEGWHNLAGDRAVVFMGDHVVEQLSAPAPSPYLAGTLGVEYVDNDVSDNLGIEDPVVTPLGSVGFSNSFRLDGGCPLYRRFDAIRPVGFGVAGHRYGLGNPMVPSVVSAYFVGAADRLYLTLPFALEAVRSVDFRSDALVQTRVLADILNVAGHVVRGDPAPTLQLPAIRLAGNHPNPFNPRTVIRFEVGRQAQYRATIYNARGERIASLWEGELDAGRHEMEWSGVDDRGRSVASGLYFLELSGDGLRRTHKMALLK